MLNNDCNVGIGFICHEIIDTLRFSFYNNNISRCIEIDWPFRMTALSALPLIERRKV